MSARPSSLHRRHSRFMATSLAVALTGGTPAAHATAPSPDIDEELETLEANRQFLEAATKARTALDNLPETFDNRSRRNALATAAVNMYLKAFEADPNQCDTIGAGLALADKYLQDLKTVYGAAINNADEYKGIDGRRNALDQARQIQGCPEPQIAEPPPPPKLEEPVDDTTRPPDPRPTDSPAPPPNTRALKIGIGVSAGLTAAMLAVSLGTGLSRYKEPFQGAAYNKIYDAAKASGDIGYGANTDMCAEGRMKMNAAVTDACDSWVRLGKVAIATGVVTVVLAVTTMALAGVLVSKQRRTGQASRMRNSLLVGASPGQRGAMHVSFGFHF